MNIFFQIFLNPNWFGFLGFGLELGIFGFLGLDLGLMLVFFGSLRLVLGFFGTRPKPKDPKKNKHQTQTQKPENFRVL